MKKVSLKLTAIEHKALEQLIFFGRFKSASEALRAGLRLALVEHGLKADALIEIMTERKARPGRRRKSKPDSTTTPTE